MNRKERRELIILLSVIILAVVVFVVDFLVFANWVRSTCR